MTPAEYREIIDQATEKVITWMVDHGAVDTGPADEHDFFSLRMLYLDDLECFIGHATCDPAEPALYATDKDYIVEYEHEVPHHHLEISALVPLVSPVALRDLEAIVADLNPGVVERYESAVPMAEDYGGNECEETSVVLDEDRNTWVTRRFRCHDIDGDRFDDIMSEFVALARVTCKRIWECPPQ